MAKKFFFGVHYTIAGRLPEKRRNSFVDLKSQSDSKRKTKKKVFVLNAEMLYFQ